MFECTEVYFNIENLNGKTTREYDENGNLILNIAYVYNLESESFFTSYKREYTYDENGNQILRINYGWSPETLFYPDNKYEMSYDENGNLTFLFIYLWDRESQTYEPNKKYSLIYDENGNRTLYINNDWSSESQSLIPDHKDEYTFDSNNFMSSLIRYKWSTGFGVFNPTLKMDISTISETDTTLVREGIISEYDSNFNTWNELEGEDLKSYIYYTKTSSLSTNSVEPNSFSIYPNPTSNKLLINSSESLSNPIFELYDVKGSKILSSPFKLTEPIDVSDLQPSMYIYNVKDGSEVKQSGKVLIE